MGQKVNPHGARVGVIYDWSTRWYAGKKEFADNLNEDFRLRKMLKEQYYSAGISRIDIERSASRMTVTMFVSRPGMIIGTRGKGPEAANSTMTIDKLRANVEKMVAQIVDPVIMERQDERPQDIAFVFRKNDPFRTVGKLYGTADRHQTDRLGKCPHYLLVHPVARMVQELVCRHIRLGIFPVFHSRHRIKQVCHLQCFHLCIRCLDVLNGTA